MARGFTVWSDVLKQTTDGRLLTDIFAEFQTTAQMINDQRDALSQLFCFRTTLATDQVLQVVDDDEFEQQSEFGNPQSMRVPSTPLTLAYDFKWRDTATRYTRSFLRDASSGQIEALHSKVLLADSRMQFREILGAVTNPAPRVSPEGNTIFGLYNGADGVIPPPVAGKIFDATWSQYMTTGGAFEGVDLDLVMNKVVIHQYGAAPTDQLVVFANPADATAIHAFRAGQVAADGNAGAWDFIPAAGSAPYLSAQTIVGDKAPASFQGLSITGSYGPALICESFYVPRGYIVVMSSAGPNSPNNPVAFREHPDPSWQGLLILPGTDPQVPLLESWYERGFGTGIRHRGAAAVLQIASNSSYAAPVIP